MKEVPLSLGLVALVDDADYAAVMAAGDWSARPSGRTVYAQRRVIHDGGYATTQQLHTFLTGWPYVDHRNGDGLDNQRANLRQSSHGQNMGKGVTQRKRDGRFQAQIQANRVHHHLGYFDTAEAAALAYDGAAREAFGAFARLNFPEVSA